MEFGTQDPWLAAYITVMGVPLTRVEILPTRRARWLFPRATAALLADDYRRGRDTAIAPIPRFRQAYRDMIDAADAAREGLPERTMKQDDERAA